MSLILKIDASTTDAQIENTIQYLDMRSHAMEVRDMARAVIDEQGDQAVLEYYEIGDVHVLHSPVWAYAYVNARSAGVGDSMLIDNNDAISSEHAAAIWLGDDAAD